MGQRSFVARSFVQRIKISVVIYRISNVELGRFEREENFNKLLVLSLLLCIISFSEGFYFMVMAEASDVEIERGIPKDSFVEKVGHKDETMISENNLKNGSVAPKNNPDEDSTSPDNNRDGDSTSSDNQPDDESACAQEEDFLFVFILYFMYSE